MKDEEKIEHTIGPCSQGETFSVQIRRIDTYPNGAYLMTGDQIDETFSVYLSTDHLREFANKLLAGADAIERSRRP